MVACLGLAPGPGQADSAEESHTGRDAGVHSSAAPSKSGYRPAKSSVEDGIERDIKVNVSPGQTILRIPITGTIDLGLAAFVRRVLEEEAALVILDINTLGGRVDAAIQIRDALLASKAKTVAYVHPRAISAGALISLACDIIAMAPGGTMGAVTPMSSGGEMSDAVAEKMTSYMRTEMRATAEAKGRRGDLAEAMVDRDVVVDGIVQAGKLLTLDTELAIKYGIANFKSDSIEAVLGMVGASEGQLQDQEESGAEKLARFLTDPAVSGLLMTLGMLGLMVELYSPGLGLPGAVGIVCLSSFFFGHAIADLAGLEEAMLFVGGVVLMLLEVFVIPGFGVAGIAGLACLFLGLAMTLTDLPLSESVSTGAWMDAVERVSVSVLAAVALGFALMRFIPRTQAGRRLVLQTAGAVKDGFVAAQAQDSLLGQRGVASTALRPAGKVKLADRTVDVLTAGEYIEAGAAVRVVEVAVGRIVVESVGEAVVKPAVNVAVDADEG